MIFNQNANGTVIMEAEHGDDLPGDSLYWGEFTDTGAGKAIAPSGTTWDRTQAGARLFTFDIATAGTFEIFHRVKTAETDTKIWLEVDGSDTMVGPPGGEGRLYFANDAPNWMWHNAFGNAFVTLAAGRHTLLLRSLREKISIDRIAIRASGDSTIAHGATDVGPAETSTDTPPTTEEPYTYADWAMDPTKDANRILLVELNHASGTVHLASRPWLSDENNAYDDWLSSIPSLEYSLGAMPDFGDLDAKNPELSENWANFHWRGYSCTLLFGDVTWKRRNFRIIGQSTIQACRSLGQRKYRFDLVGPIEKFNKTYYTGTEVTRSESARAAINWIASQDEGVTPVFMNVADTHTRPVTFTVDESSNMLDQLRSGALAMDAYLRISPTYDLDVIKPDTSGTPIWTLGEDDIVGNTLQEVSVLAPVKRILVNYGVDGGNQVSASTVALTGEFDEELEFTTVLRDSGDAQAYADNLAMLYSNIRRLWEMKVYNVAHLLQVGDYISINHPELVGSGVVRRIRSTPLSSAGTIEVLI